MSTGLSSKTTQKQLPINPWFKSFGLVLATVVIFFLGQITGVLFVYSFLALFGYDSDQIQTLLTDNAALQFLTILIIEVITLGIFWQLHRYRKLSFIKEVGLGFKPKLSSLGWAIVTYGAYFLVLIISVGLISWLVPAIDVDQSQQIGFDGASGTNLIFVFLTLVVLPPIAEEIIFRGFLFQRLEKLIKIYPAAIVTSLIFAIAHTEFLGDNPLNWIAAIDTFVLSFFLILLLVKTKSLWASILLHALKNCFAFVLLFII
jgi:membrane protease YdiL (CAAX protease family)